MTIHPTDKHDNQTNSDDLQPYSQHTKVVQIKETLLPAERPNTGAETPGDSYERTQEAVRAAREALMRCYNG